MTAKTKTNFIFEIDHPDTVAPRAIQASVVGQKGLLTWKALEIDEISPFKTRYVFQIKHPRDITPQEIEQKMEGRQGCISFKILDVIPQ